MGLLQLNSCFCFDLKTANIIIGIINAVLSITLIGVMGYCAWITKPGGPHESPIGEFLSDIFFGICSILLVILLVKYIVELLFIRGVVLERLRIINIYVNILLAYFFILILAYLVFPLYSDIFIICFKSLYFLFNIFSIILADSYYNVLKKQQEESAIVLFSNSI